MRRLGYSPRPATEADLAQVAKIESKAIRPPWPEDAFRQELVKPHSNFWVVTDDETDEKVGAYGVFSFPAEQAHLITFAVDPELLRQGLATYLLRHILAFVMRNRGESVILEVRKGNLAAIGLYQKLGFLVIRTIPKFYPDGEDAYVMLYRTEQTKLNAETEMDFDAEPEPSDGKKNFN